MYYVKNLVTDFTSSNITELYPDYDPSTTYTFQESSPTSLSICRFGSWYYRSMVNSNTGNQPDLFENTKWVKHAVANSHAMLDLSAQSKTVKTLGNLTVEFAMPWMADAIGIGMYEADTVLIELLNDADAVVWSYETETTYNESVYDWYTWTFAPRIEETDRSFAVSIPPFIATKVRVTFNAFSASHNTACGFLSCGIKEDMGCTLQNVPFKFQSYAIRAVDDFGNITITKRAVQDIVDFETVIDSTVFMRKKNIIKKDYNTIMMFVVDDSINSQYQNMVTLGLIQDASPIATEFDKDTITWTVIEAI